MRIIDKNTDFYDFYQDVYIDKTYTFDRRDSYILSKDIICNSLPIGDRYYSWREKRYKNREKYYLLLQVCNTFWLFKLKIIEFNNYNKPIDYSVELLANWRNFNKKRELIRLDILSQIYPSKFLNKKLSVEELITEVDRTNYKILKNLNHYTIFVGKDKVDKHIPILKASGLASLINSHEIFLAIEEYFALEKSDLERREPLGTTDIDKIESHGFDKKISFRGK